jgi:hypothetical protein
MTIRQSSAIHFPPNPATGQEYLADNNVTYIWTGNRWSAIQAIATRRAEYTVDGQFADHEYDPLVDIILDGGTA